MPIVSHRRHVDTVLEEGYSSKIKLSGCESIMQSRYSCSIFSAGQPKKGILRLSSTCSRLILIF